MNINIGKEVGVKKKYGYFFRKFCFTHSYTEAGMGEKCCYNSS